jgi:hypothetical protein
MSRMVSAARIGIPCERGLESPFLPLPACGKGFLLVLQSAA